MLGRNRTFPWAPVIVRFANLGVAFGRDLEVHIDTSTTRGVEVRVEVHKRGVVGVFGGGVVVFFPPSLY
jgi:hypothetical protein